MEYAEKNGMFFIETSAKTADNINQLFEVHSVFFDQKLDCHCFLGGRQKPYHQKEVSYQFDIVFFVSDSFIPCTVTHKDLFEIFGRKLLRGSRGHLLPDSDMVISTHEIA